MENFNKYIDTSFDSHFEGNDNYPWFPWIGKTYSQSKVKTLILGESTYNWGKKADDRKKVDERISKNNHLRIVHKNNAIHRKGKSPYAKSIERAIFSKKKTTLDDAQIFWTNVVYHNLVLRAMPTIKHRPKYEDYLNGWLTFIDLSKNLNVDQCIVYGLERKKLKSLKEALDSKGIEYKLSKTKESVGKSYPRIASITFDGKEIKMVFIRHPSSFFSWRKWGEVLNRELSISSLV